MSIIEPNAGAASIIDRAKNILLAPRDEWPKIAAEPGDVGKLYMGYALPLMVIGAVCGVIGMSVFGFGALGVNIRVPILTALVSGAVQVVLGLAMLFGLGLVIKALAPSFASQPDQMQAHKLAVYSSTAGLAASVFTIHPQLSVLAILGLYSFALLYMGMPRLIGTPEDKRLPFIATLVVIALVAGLVLGGVMNAMRPAGLGALGGAGLGAGAASSAQSQVTITTPGGGSVTINGEQAPAAAENMESAAALATGTVDVTQLQALLPESLPGGFQRTAISSVSGAMAMGAATAQATYTNGARSIDLTASHLGPMAGLGQLGVSMNAQANSETENGYERMRTEGGRTITETLDRASGTAEYAVLTTSGVALQASGSGGVTPDQLRAVVEAVGVERIERLIQPAQ